MEWPEALWKQPLVVREWRTGADAVLRDAERPGRWRVVWPDHSGWLHCREVETGRPCWRYELAGPTRTPVTGDVDGDGRDEIVIAGSDGRVVALRDAGDEAEILWQVDLGMPAGTPLMADVNGDSASEIIVGAADGALYVLGAGG